MNTRSKYISENIIPHFQFRGKFSHAELCSIGHINDTYTTYFYSENGEKKRYILQRINNLVFKSPEKVLSNIAAITEHLRRKISDLGGDPDREALTLIQTHDNQFLHITEDGNYWRAYDFIENAQTYQIPESHVHVYNAGKAYGNFQQMLSDFPVDILFETIPDFHNTPKRYQAFLSALEADKYSRAKGAEEEIKFILQRAEEIHVLEELINQGDIQLRVTHNDTKFNNVMIDDETGEGICILDLDTVMPGSLLYDFGDAIRSIANTALEDERNLDAVHFDIDTYEKFARGYLAALADTITSQEVELLAFSANLMTLECGMRFLTDHLDGDNYFRVHRESHNLDRCRTQFKLIAEMEEKFPLMKAIVDSALS